jgi:phosphoglycolate phosphatase-like HAD superfamily hydrolase
MIKSMIPAMVAAALGLAPASAQDKPAIVVHAFTLASGVTFPYDMNQLQTQAIAMLKDKDGTLFDAVPTAAAGQARVYVLDGEVLEWHKGNTAERLLIAAGSVAGRENAKIHFWLTDKDGKKIFENTDTIRQGFMKNTHEKNSGTLATPFAEKLTERLKEAKLAPAT